MKLIISNIENFKWSFNNNQLNPVFTTEKIVSEIKLLFDLLKNNYTNVSKDDDTNCYVMFFRALKGKYTDDETYKNCLKYNEIEEAQFIKNNWNIDYPNRYKWFSLVFYHTFYNDINYFAFYLDHRQIFSISDEKFSSYDWRHSYILKPIKKIVKEHIKLCANNEFEIMFDKTFGYEKRRGIIEFKKVWEFYPSLKKKYLYQLRKLNLKKVFDEAYKDDITYFSKMSSGKYFDICKIGYLGVDKTINKQIDSKTLFYKKADGRTLGLENIDINSEEEFDKWFKEHGVSPDHCFEIFPGRSFYRGDLYICNNGKEYYLELSGSDYHTEIDILKFYNSLLKEGIKVKLLNKELFKSRIDGNAIFAIESEDNWCYGYTTVFGKCYIDSIHIKDFPKLIPAVQWEEILMSKYIGKTKVD